MPSAFPIFILAIQISILTVQKKLGCLKKFGRPKKILIIQKHQFHMKKRSKIKIWTTEKNWESRWHWQ